MWLGIQFNEINQSEAWVEKQTKEEKRRKDQ